MVSIAFEMLASAPALDASEQAAITQLVRALTADRSTRKVAYGTEAGLFQQLGIPSIVCGPELQHKRVGLLLCGTNTDLPTLTEHLSAACVPSI